MAAHIRRLLIIPALLAAGQALAQEGHPFDGTWRGTLSDASGESQRVLLILKYDGAAIGGMINPGPNSVPLDSAELDAPNWTLRASAQSADGPIEFQATLRDIGSPRRYMEGTWTENGEDYAMRVTRE